MSSTCPSTVPLPTALLLLLLSLLLLALILLNWYTRRSYLLAIYDDPRNIVVTFLKAKDFKATANNNPSPADDRSKRRSKHRDVLEEGKKILDGTAGEQNKLLPWTLLLWALLL